MKLIVARHGESQANAANLIGKNSIPEKEIDHLSEKGKKQAKELVKKLDKYEADVVIVSPLNRTRETIQPYLDKHNVNVIVSDLTSERNAGVFAGMDKYAMKEYREARGISDAVSFKPEEGESLIDVYERAKKFLDYLKKNFKGKTVFLCGHVNFITCLEIAIGNKEIKDFYKCERIDNCELREYELS